MLQKTCQLETASVLAGSASLLAGGLARAGDMASLHAIAARLPTFCHAGFECQLTDDEPGVDFLYCLRRLEESRHLAGTPATNVVWQRLRHFATVWRSGADGLDRIPNAWLEFDLRDRAAEEPVPSPFVHVPATDPGVYDATIEHVGRALQVARSPATRAAMMRIYGMFGPLSSACETGFWLARSTPAIRMVFMKMLGSLEDTVDLLARAGHPDPSILRRAPVPALWRMPGSVAIGVDVAEDVSPNCAIELYPLPPDRAFQDAVHEEAQRRLLDELVSAGLCTPDKRARVMSWHGRDRYGADRDLRATIWLRRALHHVKLSLKPGQPVSAKAYLSLSALAVREERTALASA